LADLTAGTMRMGTKTRKTLEIEEAMGDLGSSIYGGAGRESSTLGFEVLKRNLAAALNVLSDVVLHPVFPDSEVDLQKKRRLDMLSQQAASPFGIAFRIAPMISYGANHPYGTPTGGLPGTVGKLTRADFVSFHEEYWKPGSSALIFAGDVTLDEAVAMAKQAFGPWGGGSRPPLTIPAPAPLGKGKTYLVDRRDSTQTAVMQIVDAPPRASEDYYALRLADAVWGGAVSARLNMNIREEKGYSYGVFSFPELHSKAGTWRAWGTVQTDKTKESLVEFNKELLFISGEKPVTETELALARANRIRSYAQQFESLGRVAGQVAELWALGLPLTELQREAAELGKATLPAVNAVAKKYVKPDASIMLLVGDLSKIEAGAREVIKGDIVTLDVEGNIIGK
jgi:zinc protease